MGGIHALLTSYSTLEVKCEEVDFDLFVGVELFRFLNLAEVAFHEPSQFGKTVFFAGKAKHPLYIADGMRQRTNCFVPQNGSLFLEELPNFF